MKVTINDVAKAAGVSKSTVSNVINNYSWISQRTREKVLKIMDELKFVPDRAARNLAKKSSYSITVLIDIDRLNYFSDIFFYNIILGAESFAFEKDYNISICNLSLLNMEDKFLERFIYNKSSAGMILPASILSESIIELLRAYKIPFVVIGDPGKLIELNWVDIDNKRGSYLALEYLKKNGYEKTAFIGGNSEDIIPKSRVDGFIQAGEDLGLDLKSEYIKVNNNTIESGFISIKELFDLNNPPDSVICNDNFSALGVYNALNEANIRIPDDFGIIAFNSIPLADYLSPKLTTIDINTFELGYKATEMLFKLIEEDEEICNCILLEPEIIIREST